MSGLVDCSTWSCIYGTCAVVVNYAYTITRYTLRAYVRSESGILGGAKGVGESEKRAAGKR